MIVDEFLSFIHLSDIHFNKYSGDPYDIDSDLRNELIRDSRENATANLKNIQGILVCGDVAFSGQLSEYKIALNFLNDLCSKIGIINPMVFTVPGNHDVDRSVCKASFILSQYQTSLEANSMNADDIDDNISKYSHDPTANGVIYKHIATYNEEFASRFNCSISVERPTWDQTFTLHQGYTLRIHGMNSVSISSHLDNNQGTERGMIIGRHQAPQNASKTINMSLCHHPPACWKDPENLTAMLMNNRSHIQLYGHKHIPTILQDEHSLIIGSGAMQPPRKEAQWIPYYNWISIGIDGSQEGEKLIIRVYPRKYENNIFISDASSCDDGKNYKEFCIMLSATVIPEKEKAERTPEVLRPSIMAESQDEITDFIIKKTVIYDFMDLPFIYRCKVLDTLSLLDENDAGVNHVKILDKILLKVFENDCLDKFRQEIERYKS